MIASCDTLGAVVRYLDEPYGQQIRSWLDPTPGTTADDHSEDSLYTQIATDTNPYRFRCAQGYLDSATGLIKFGTRFYSPRLGTLDPNGPPRRISRKSDLMERVPVCIRRSNRQHRSLGPLVLELQLGWMLESC